MGDVLTQLVEQMLVTQLEVSQINTQSVVSVHVHSVQQQHLTRCKPLCVDETKLVSLWVATVRGVKVVRVPESKTGRPLILSAFLDCHGPDQIDGCP